MSRILGLACREVVFLHPAQDKTHTKARKETRILVHGPWKKRAKIKTTLFLSCYNPFDHLVMNIEWMQGILSRKSRDWPQDFSAWYFLLEIVKNGKKGLPSQKKLDNAGSRAYVCVVS